jgi:hypothetical protein
MAKSGPTNEDWAKDHDVMARADRKHAKDPVQSPTAAKAQGFLDSATYNEAEARKLRGEKA